MKESRSRSMGAAVLALVIAVMAPTAGGASGGSAAEQPADGARAGTAWSRTRVSKSPSVPSEWPEIAASGPVVHVVWQEGSSPSDVWYRHSLDQGATWSGKRLLERTTADGERATVAVHGSTVVVAWEDDRSGTDQIYLRRSTDTGSTWSRAMNMSGRTGTAWEADLTYGDGAFHLVYSRDTTGSGNYEIFYRRSTDNGATWSKARRITWNAGPSDTPDVVADANGITVAYAQFNKTWTRSQIRVLSSANDGATWGPETDVSQSPVISIGPRLAISGRTRVVAWVESSSSSERIFRALSRDDGATWNPRRKVTTEGIMSSTGGMASAGQTVRLVVASYGGTDYEVYLLTSQDRGRTWSAPERVSRLNDWSARPAIDIEGGVTHIVYEDSASGATDFDPDVIHATPASL